VKRTFVDALFWLAVGFALGAAVMSQGCAALPGEAGAFDPDAVVDGARSAVSLLDASRDTVVVHAPGGACSGVVLADGRVLTAQHCWGGTVAEPLQESAARVTDFRSGSKQNYQAEAALAQPAEGYDQVALDQPPGLPTGRAGICAEEQPPAGRFVWLSGYGCSAGTDYPMLRQGIVVQNFANDGLSATVFPELPCHGDSGGPIFMVDDAGNACVWATLAGFIDNGPASTTLVVRAYGL
jgi:hypothetical protein